MFLASFRGPLVFLELMATFRIEDAKPRVEYFVDWRNSAMGLLLTLGTPKNKAVHY